MPDIRALIIACWVIMHIHFGVRRIVSLLFILLGWLPAMGVAQSLQVEQPIVLVADEEQAFMQPRWSPDGTSLVLTGPRYQGLWRVEVSRGVVVQLTDEMAAGFGVRWSADSEALLSRVARYEGPRRYNAVKVFDALGATSQQLTEYRTHMPALPLWASDQSRVLLPAGRQVEVLETGRPINPSKAGELVYLVQGVGVHYIDGTSDERATLQHPNLPEGDVLNAVASPAGTHLAFEMLGGNLYILSTDGSSLVDVGRGHRPQWSPDGEWVVFQRTRDDGYSYTEAELVAVRVNGTEETQLTQTPGVLEMNPHWSPDGRFIAYDADGAIYLLPITQ